MGRSIKWGEVQVWTLHSEPSSDIAKSTILCDILCVRLYCWASQYWALPTFAKFFLSFLRFYNILSDGFAHFFRSWHSINNQHMNRYSKCLKWPESKPLLAHCALYCAACWYADQAAAGSHVTRDTCPRCRTLLRTRVIRSFQRESQVKSWDKWGYNCT